MQSAQRPIKRQELNGQGAGSRRSKSQEKEQTLCQEMLTPEREGDNKVQLPSQLSADVVAGVGAGEAGQNLQQLRDKLSEDACKVPGEGEEGKAFSSVSSEWSSSILEMESPTLSQGKAPERQKFRF